MSPPQALSGVHLVKRPSAATAATQQLQAVKRALFLNKWVHLECMTVHRFSCTPLTPQERASFIDLNGFSHK